MFHYINSAFVHHYCKNDLETINDYVAKHMKIWMVWEGQKPKNIFLKLEKSCVVKVDSGNSEETNLRSQSNIQ